MHKNTFEINTKTKIIIYMETFWEKKKTSERNKNHGGVFIKMRIVYTELFFPHQIHLALCASGKSTHTLTAVWIMCLFGVMVQNEME